MVGQEAGIVILVSVSERRDDTSGKKCLCRAERGNIIDYLSLYQSRLPGSLRDTSRAPLGWSSAPELGQAPETEGSPGNPAVLQRGRSAQKQLLCKAQQL